MQMKCIKISNTNKDNRFEQKLNLTFKNKNGIDSTRADRKKNPNTKR